MKIKDLPKIERPREKLIAKTPENLKDKELLASQELVKRALDKRDESLPKISSVEDVLAQVVYMRDKTREHLMALFLNARNELLHKKPMFIATLNTSLQT